MSNFTFKIGDRVRHKSSKYAPGMVIYYIGTKHSCRYWNAEKNEFVTVEVIPEEIVLAEG